jgi:hypothetical protein
MSKTAEEIQKEMCYLSDGRFKGTSCITSAMQEFSNQQCALKDKEIQELKEQVEFFEADIPRNIKIIQENFEYKKEIESLKNELKNSVKLSMYYFDYVQSVQKDNGKWVGSMETAYIEAYSEEHAILKFKELYPDKKFDSPYL